MDNRPESVRKSGVFIGKIQLSEINEPDAALPVESVHVGRALIKIRKFFFSSNPKIFLTLYVGHRLSLWHLFT